jgi:hypothetical protein
LEEGFNPPQTVPKNRGGGNAFKFILQDKYSLILKSQARTPQEKKIADIPDKHRVKNP